MSKILSLNRFDINLKKKIVKYRTILSSLINKAKKSLMVLNFGMHLCLSNLKITLNKLILFMYIRHIYIKATSISTNTNFIYNDLKILNNDRLFKKCLLLLIYKH